MFPLEIINMVIAQMGGGFRNPWNPPLATPLEIHVDLSADCSNYVDLGYTYLSLTALV